VTPIANPSPTPRPRTRDLPRNPASTLLALGLALAVAWPTAARANEGQIIGTANQFFPDPGYRPKDFTILKDDNGAYHIFYIRHDTSEPAANEIALGHATSPNLYDWSNAHPVVVPIESPVTWDDSHVWAPTIVRDAGGTYYMFFTGVHDITGAQLQRIGVATSTDLYNWTNRTLVMDCESAVPWSRCADFRDPFVMPDPTNAGHWLMYYTTRPKMPSELPQFPFPYLDPNFVPDTTSDFVIGMARSTTDLFHWEDVYPIWITYRAYSFNNLLESPHVFAHNGLWYLMVTTNSGKPLSFFTGPDPTIQTYLPQPNTPSWTYRGRLANIFPHAVPTVLPDPTPGSLPAYAASEYFKDSNGDEYFAAFDAQSVVIRQIVWHPAPEFEFDWVEPVRPGFGFSNSNVTQGSLVTMTIGTQSDDTGRPANLEWFDVAGGNRVKLADPGMVGLPTSLTLTGTSTSVSFRPYVNPVDVPQSSVYICQYLGQSPPLHVNGPPPGGCCYEFPENMTPAGSGEAAAPHALSLEAKGGARVELSFGIPHGMQARIDVFDVSGRHVTTLANGWVAAGLANTTWDGGRDDGGRVGSGVYFARLVTVEGARVARFVLAR
jgi:hypothetical protein